MSDESVVRSTIVAPRMAVTWCDASATHEAVCPVCSTAGAKRAVLSTRSFVRDHGVITLLSCSVCSNLFWNDLDPYPYEEGLGLPWGLDFYIEQGAGVDALIEPIARLPFGPGSRCLEIGCGYGFSIDAAERQLGWRGIGVDPSPLAEAGRAGLGVDIRPIYATRALEVGSDFDVVYASEVIEHVADPFDFLAVCAAHLADDGVLVLTTPDAASIEPNIPLAELILALSPGLHVILYTAEGLAHALRKAGFGHISVSSRGYRLVAYASRRPLDFDASAPLDRQRYRDYLAGVLGRPELPASLRRGLHYRLLKELTNAGHYAAARQVLAPLAAEIGKTFGLVLGEALSNVVVDKIRHAGQTGDFPAPWCLPGILYFAGVIALNGDMNYAAAAALFDQAGCAAAAFREAYRSVGVDDGETADFESDAARLALLALCRVDARKVVNRLRGETRVTPMTTSQVFCTLVDLGHLAAAADLEDCVEMERGWHLFAARGMLALLHHGLPDRAGAWFATSWADAVEAKTPPVAQECGRIKYHEVMAWIAAGDAGRASAAARELLAPEYAAWSTDKTKHDLQRLLAAHPAVRDLMGRG